MTDIVDSNDPWEMRCNAIYKAELSALYHQKRERFFELMDKLTKAVALFGGSAALWKIADPGIVSILAVAITASSALSLVFSFSDRSKRHSELAMNYRTVIAEIEAKGRHNFTAEDADAWSAKLCTLDAKEPPALSALIVLCQNELAIAKGHPGHVHRQNFLVRSILAHFFDLPRHA